MSLMLSAELAAVCNALGEVKGNEIRTHDNDDNNLIETVKDLIRYLRRDTESHEIRRYFGASNILASNLIPIIKFKHDHKELFDVVLRLMGNLTSPVLLLYNEEIPKEITVRNQFLQILGHLQAYKQAFDDEEFWKVLTTKLAQLLNIEYQERGEENGLIIERILILVRNVLNVPADQLDENRADNDVSAHDKVIYMLKNSGLAELLVYMVSSEDEEAYYMYILEIVSLMLREHRANDLANAGLERTKSEKTQDEAEFSAVRRQEITQRNDRLKSFTSARHSRFGGTFVFTNQQSVHDTQELIYHKALNKVDVLNYDADKSKVKIAKHRAPMQDSTSYRRSPFYFRLLLKSFCIDFLNAGYNRLMHNVRGKLLRGKSMSNDETYYLWAMKYFMEFNRHHKFDVKLVSETMAIPIFHYVQQQMEHFFDMVSSDKQKWPLWSKRLHVALLTYKELLLNLNAMDKSKDTAVRESTKVIKSNVFYVLEYREFILTLLLTYNPLKMSKAYLFDLMETQHIFLKTLQTFCGQDSSVVVQRKQKIKRKKKKQPQPSKNTMSITEILERKWDELSPQISAVLEGGENIPVVVPFDASSKVPIDEQKKDAMVKIQNYLREDEIENAIGLLRAARDVWPENDSFGRSAISLDEEFMAMREIFFTELEGGVPAENLIPPPTTEVYDDEEDEEDEEDSDMDRDIEVDFKFQDFVNRFAHPKVVQACGLALCHFNTNSVNINHCVLKLLHRISWDCRMPAMIFQASIFRTFQRIYEERHRREHKELVKFATYTFRQFIKVAEKNPKVFMELLFWKNSREAYDVEEGYGSYHEKSKAMKTYWSEQEEDELRMLVVEYREKEIEEDAVDWLVKNLIDHTKTRRMVIKKLKDLMLMDYKPGKKSTLSSRPPKDWEEHEIVQLTELYNLFKDAADPMGCILARLEMKRPKVRVIQKLLDLGLVDDRKELKKKRVSNRQREGDGISSHSQIESDSSDNVSSDDGSDDNNLQRKSSFPENSKKTSKRTSKSTGRKNIFACQADTNAVKQILINVTNKEMTSSLKWLSDSLNEAVEDMEQEIDLDDNEGIPLVPIAEEDVLAMDDPSFKKALVSIGIKKPADEQEAYWRIPGYLKAEEIQKILSVINEVLEKGSAAIVPEADSSDEDVFVRLRNLISKADVDDSDHAIGNTSQDVNNVRNSQIQTMEIVEKSKNLTQDESEKKTNLSIRNHEQNADFNDNSHNSGSDSEDENTLISTNYDKNDKNKYKMKRNTDIKNIKHKKRMQVQSYPNTSDNEQEQIQIIDITDKSNIPQLLKKNLNNDQQNTIFDSLFLSNNDDENQTFNSSKNSKKRIQVITDSDESDNEQSNQNEVEISESLIAESKRSRESNSDSESHERVIKKKRIAIIDSDDD